MCSSHSTPGPDHITWAHLKYILTAPEVEKLILNLANACMEVAHWPKHFKDLVSVIILFFLKSVFIYWGTTGSLVAS